MSRCRSCGAEIIWQKTGSGSNIPMNKNGVCHFETCPQATQWRGKRKLEQEDHVLNMETLDSKQMRLS